MKDIVITSKRIQTELFVFLACFAAAFMVNIWAVISYSRPVIELLSQIGYVFVLSLIIYAGLAVVRVLIRLISALFS